MKKINKIDMAWGSPSFLAPYWNKTKIKTDHIKRTKNYEFGSRRTLKRLIKKIHKKANNADLTNKHIVIGAGASQIIFGLLSVLREVNGYKKATAQPPHFSRFPLLANAAKVEWQDKQTDNAIIITTNPNNPDSTISDYKSSQILDLCYNWPQYKDVVKYNHPIMVFSLSKAVGLANTRIGWAIIKDKIIAKKLEQWIEITTGGLSIDAQIKAEATLKHELHPFRNHMNVFSHGKNIMDIRWEKINSNRHKFPFDIINNDGMFLWAKGTCPTDINYLSGQSLGSSEEYFRLNVGCSSKHFKLFLKLFNID